MPTDDVMLDWLGEYVRSSIAESARALLYAVIDKAISATALKWWPIIALRVALFMVCIVGKYG